MKRQVSAKHKLMKDLLRTKRWVSLAVLICFSFGQVYSYAQPAFQTPYNYINNYRTYVYNPHDKVVDMGAVLEELLLKNFAFQPPLLHGCRLEEKGVTLFVDRGDAIFDTKRLQVDYRQLAGYFYTGFLVEDEAFWVNLTPDAPDRIVDPRLEKTVVGRIFLETDLQLKKDAALLTHPKSEIGKRYWDAVYRTLNKYYPGGNYQVPIMNRFWIVPAQASVQVSGSTVGVSGSSLHVQIERDHFNDTQYAQGSNPALEKELEAITRQIVVPPLTVLVNTSRKYAQLRRVYNALILARYLKQKGVTAQAVMPASGKQYVYAQGASGKQALWKEYSDSYSGGEYAFQVTGQAMGQKVLRTFSSGGLDFMGFAPQVVPGNPAGRLHSYVPLQSYPGASDLRFDRIPGLIIPESTNGASTVRRTPQYEAERESWRRSPAPASSFHPGVVHGYGGSFWRMFGTVAVVLSVFLGSAAVVPMFAEAQEDWNRSSMDAPTRSGAVSVEDLSGKEYIWHHWQAMTQGYSPMNAEIVWDKVDWLQADSPLRAVAADMRRMLESRGITYGSARSGDMTFYYSPADDRNNRPAAVTIDKPLTSTAWFNAREESYKNRRGLTTGMLPITPDMVWGQGVDTSDIMWEGGVSLDPLVPEVRQAADVVREILESHGMNYAQAQRDGTTFYYEVASLRNNRPAMVIIDEPFSSTQFHKDRTKLLDQSQSLYERGVAVFEPELLWPSKKRYKGVLTHRGVTVDAMMPTVRARAEVLKTRLKAAGITKGQAIQQGLSFYTLADELSGGVVVIVASSTPGVDPQVLFPFDIQDRRPDTAMRDRAAERQEQQEKLLEAAHKMRAGQTHEERREGMYAVSRAGGGRWYPLWVLEDVAAGRSNIVSPHPDPMKDYRDIRADRKVAERLLYGEGYFLYIDRIIFAELEKMAYGHNDALAQEAITRLYHLGRKDALKKITQDVSLPQSLRDAAYQYYAQLQVIPMGMVRERADHEMAQTWYQHVRATVSPLAPRPTRAVPHGDVVTHVLGQRMQEGRDGKNPAEIAAYAQYYLTPQAPYDVDEYSFREDELPGVVDLVVLYAQRYGGGARTPQGLRENVRDLASAVHRIPLKESLEGKPFGLFDPGQGGVHVFLPSESYPRASVMVLAHELAHYYGKHGKMSVEDIMLANAFALEVIIKHDGLEGIGPAYEELDSWTDELLDACKQLKWRYKVRRWFRNLFFVRWFRSKESKAHDDTFDDFLEEIKKQVLQKEEHFHQGAFSVGEIPDAAEREAHLLQESEVELQFRRHSDMSGIDIRNGDGTHPFVYRFGTMMGGVAHALAQQSGDPDNMYRYIILRSYGLDAAQAQEVILDADRSSFERIPVPAGETLDVFTRRMAGEIGVQPGVLYSVLVAFNPIEQAVSPRVSLQERIGGRDYLEVPPHLDGVKNWRQAQRVWYYGVERFVHPSRLLSRPGQGFWNAGYNDVPVYSADGTVHYIHHTHLGRTAQDQLVTVHHGGDAYRVTAGKVLRYRGQGSGWKRDDVAITVTMPHGEVDAFIDKDELKDERKVETPKGGSVHAFTVGLPIAEIIAKYGGVVNAVVRLFELANGGEFSPDDPEVREIVRALAAQEGLTEHIAQARERVEVRVADQSEEFVGALTAAVDRVREEEKDARAFLEGSDEVALEKLEGEFKEIVERYGYTSFKTLCEAAGKNAGYLFEDGLPAVKHAFGIKFMKEHWGGFVQLGVAAGENAGYLFDYGLSAVRRVFGIKFMKKHWGGFVQIGVAAGDHVVYLFQNCLPAVRDAFGIKFMKDHWGGFVQIGVAAREENAVDLLRYGLRAVLDAFGIKFMKEHWDGFVHLGVAAGENAGDLFKYGLLAVLGVFGIKFMKKHWDDFVKLGVAAGENAGDLFRHGPLAVRDAFGIKFMKDHWGGFVQIGVAAGKNAGYLFEDGLPAVKPLITDRASLGKRGDELIKVLQRCLGVEEQSASALQAVSPLIEKLPFSWDTLIKPVFYQQTQRAFLCVQEVSKLFDVGAIKDQADLDFLKWLIEAQGVRAYDTLSNFIVCGVQRGVIATPLSSKESSLKRVLAVVHDVSGLGLAGLSEEDKELSFPIFYWSDAGAYKVVRMINSFREIAPHRNEILEQIDRVHRDVLFFSRLGIPEIGGKLQIYTDEETAGRIAQSLSQHFFSTQRHDYGGETVVTVILPPVVNAAQSWELVQAVLASGIIPEGVTMQYQATFGGDLGDEAKYIAYAYWASSVQMFPLVWNAFKYPKDVDGLLVPGGGVTAVCHPLYPDRGGVRTDFRGRILTGEFATAIRKQLPRDMGRLQLLVFAMQCAQAEDPTPLQEAVGAIYNERFKKPLRRMLASKNKHRDAFVAALEKIDQEHQIGLVEEIKAMKSANFGRILDIVWLNGNWDELYQNLKAHEALLHLSHALCALDDRGDDLAEKTARSFASALAMMLNDVAVKIRDQVMTSSPELAEEHIMIACFNRLLDGVDLDGSGGAVHAFTVGLPIAEIIARYGGVVNTAVRLFELANGGEFSPDDPEVREIVRALAAQEGLSEHIAQARQVAQRRGIGLSVEQEWDMIESSFGSETAAATMLLGRSVYHTGIEQEGKVVAVDGERLRIQFAEEDHERLFLADLTVPNLLAIAPDGTRHRLKEALPQEDTEPWRRISVSTEKEHKAQVREAIERGLTYEEAEVWRQLRLDGERMPMSFWKNEETARNSILVTLDTVPGFREAREAGDIKTMAQLYREHVIQYRAVDRERYKADGQLTFFYEQGGLRGLVGNHRDFLDKLRSGAALLRFALPGLIDSANPDALDPLEVEKHYWTDPANARRHTLETLDAIPGFQAARKAEDIKAMAQLYRDHVIGYRSVDAERYGSGGQLAFFYEQGGLSGLMTEKRPYLAKLSSPATLLRFVLPGLIDLTNPDALDPLEVEKSYWTDPANARYHILKALDTIPAFQSARQAGDIATMAQLYRRHVIGYKRVDRERYKADGQQAFFCEQGGLSGLMESHQKYLSKQGSPATLLRFVLPGLIDLTNPDALDPREVEKGYWQDSENARRHILETLDAISGFHAARQAGDIKAMAQLYRDNVIGYQPVDTAKYTTPGQRAFFCERGGLSGLMANDQAYLDKINSSAALVRFAIPGLIDVANPDALDPLEVENNYWTDPANARRHILEALDSIPGFKTAREAGDIKTMAQLYREHVIVYKPVDAATYHQEGQATFFRERGGLSGLLVNAPDYLDQANSPAALVRFAVPGLIDASNGDALHPHEVTREVNPAAVHAFTVGLPIAEIINVLINLFTGKKHQQLIPVLQRGDVVATGVDTESGLFKVNPSCASAFTIEEKVNTAHVRLLDAGDLVRHMRKDFPECKHLTQEQRIAIAESISDAFKAGRGLIIPNRQTVYDGGPEVVVVEDDAGQVFIVAAQGFFQNGRMSSDIARTIVAQRIPQVVSFWARMRNRFNSVFNSERASPITRGRAGSPSVSSSQQPVPAAFTPGGIDFRTLTILEDKTPYSYLYQFVRK